VTVSIACDRTHDLVGRDHVHVRAEGGGASTGRTVELKKGESQDLRLSVKELFGSAGAITSGSTVTVEVSHMDGPGGKADFRVPFSGSSTFAVGTGSYIATVALA
jgi:hypothetical protein